MYNDGACGILPAAQKHAPADHGAISGDVYAIAPAQFEGLRAAVRWTVS